MLLDTNEILKRFSLKNKGKKTIKFFTTCLGLIILIYGIKKFNIIKNYHNLRKIKWLLVVGETILK